MCKKVKINFRVVFVFIAFLRLGHWILRRGRFIQFVPLGCEFDFFYYCRMVCRSYTIKLALLPATAQLHIREWRDFLFFFDWPEGKYYDSWCRMATRIGCCDWKYRRVSNGECDFRRRKVQEQTFQYVRRRPIVKYVLYTYC